MKFTLRSKLMLIVGSAFVSLVLVVGGETLVRAEQQRALQDVEGRLVPKLSLGQSAEADFERLRQAMQDAVAAQDRAALEATAQIRDGLVAAVVRPGALGPDEASALRQAIESYDRTARDISIRMIEGETGEKLVEDIPRMQAQQVEVTELITRTASLSQAELAAGFAAVRRAGDRAARFRLGIGMMGVALMLGLSFWISTGVVRSVDRLSRGFARFATGQFDRRIPVSGGDELARVAAEANAMAANLKQLSEEREQVDWLKAGQAGLSDELRAEPDPARLAERALRYLAERTDASLGVFHAVNDDGAWVVTAAHALPVVRGEAGVTRPGEGLVGVAALRDEVTVISDVPDAYFRIRSGLGEMKPSTIVLSPMLYAHEAVAVVELGFRNRPTEAKLALLESVRPMLASAVASARANAATRSLLERTQEQADRLVAQEEELRLSNQDLQSQQEELRRANEELEAQRETLSSQNEELEATKTRLQEKAEQLTRASGYKSQFLANMSHELRTPLNSMLLLSHLLADNEDGSLTPKHVQHCKTIHSAGQDLLALINQVLDLAKIEAGHQDVDIAKAPLQRFADHARRVFEPLAADKGLRLVVDVASGLPESITTDAQRLERVLTNLIGNAIKFTEHGQVALRIDRPDPKLKISRADVDRETAISFAVSDTGIGIALEAQERVFAPFEQLETRADRRYAGTGLGLAIARESVGLLGGELVVHSRPGEGSTFTCVLPTEPPDKTAAPPPTALASDDRTRLRDGEAHLLVIEDDPRFAEQLLDIIRARGVKAVIAESGAEGLRLARELRPCGIILDVRLPDIDGWTVMEQLRRDEATARTPVHFVSSLDEAERGLSLGAVGYLTKPATRAELAAVVQTLTAKPSSDGVRRILVVEDDLREGQCVVELLAQGNIEATLVTTAAAALAALDSDRYACMVLDLGLPDMDGLGLLEALNARDLPHAPSVVIHTGRALTKPETRQLEAYAAAVVLKDGDSAERLVHEVRLFVRHLLSGLPEERKSEPAPPVVVDVSLTGRTILLAEDDMRTAYAVSALLRGKGARVLLAETGREALDLLGNHPEIGGVLMDVMMPEMDGYEAMRRLRENERFRDLPVIALTAKAMKGERERCLEAGASDYLTKPVDSDRLLATLGVWMGREAK